MFCRPEDELKKRFRELGISYRDVANYIGRRYSVVNNWMNGFALMPTDARLKIEKLMTEWPQSKVVEQKENGR